MSSHNKPKKSFGQVNRRDFLKATGIAGLSTFTPPTILSALAQSSQAVDALVIGSGFGGAVAARRLTQQGYHVTMLERGQRWPKTPNAFSSLTNPDGRSTWIRDSTVIGQPQTIDRHLGVLDIEIGNGMAALAGAGYGGGSLVYAGALYEPSEALFNQVLGSSVDYWEMASIFYPKVRNELSPSPIPQEILAYPEYKAAKRWLQLGRQAGLNTLRVDMGLNWNKVLKELKGKLPASVTAGEFWYGNNSGAKKTLDKNYLRRAENTGRLSVETQQDVISIEEGPEGRYIVTTNELNLDGSVIGQKVYVAEKVFLCAGSLGTSKLLVKSREKGHLPALNDQVGLHWGNNGDMFTAITGFGNRVLPNTPGTASVAIEDHDNPLAPTAVEAFADWETEGQSGLIRSLGMTTPPAKGYFSYDASTDGVTLNWPSTDPDILRTIEAGEATYQKLIDRMGGTGGRHKVEAGMRKIRMRRELGQDPLFAGATAHPLGGAVLGKATDNVGRLQNYSGLYVMDSALIEGHTGCTNPALTVAALAERNIERILYEDF